MSQPVVTTQEDGFVNQKWKKLDFRNVMKMHVNSMDKNSIDIVYHESFKFVYEFVSYGNGIFCENILKNIHCNGIFSHSFALDMSLNFRHILKKT